MTTIATVRNCVWPAPVYEARFRHRCVLNEMVLCMSFWQAKKLKHWDHDRGRNITMTAFARQFPGWELVDGYVEHNPQSGPRVRERDPIFEPSNLVEMKPNRITAKQARATLAEAIRDVEQCLRDAGWTREAIDRDAKLNRYRQIAA